MSANKSIAQNFTFKQGLHGSAIAAGVAGTSVDTAGYNEAAVVLSIGTAGAGTCDVKVQDSADNSAWADVTGAAFAQVANADDNKTFVGMLKLDGNTVRRYIRVNSTTATATVEHSVVFILANKQYKPDQAASFIV